MKNVKSIADLLKIKEEYLAKSTGKKKEGLSGEIVHVKVHMGTSGIASGAREIYDFLLIELEKRNIHAIVKKTGDMGYCFAEPTIEVTRSGQDPLVFGYVDKLRADEIIEKYIKNGEYIEGILPLNYRKII